MIFRYRLNGLDRDWTTNDKLAVYEDIPTGDYTFEVVAVDRNLTYSKKPATVALEIHPPYERIGWVSALCFAVAMIGWQAVRIVHRDRLIQEQTRRKSDFLAHMSHGLRTPLNAIIGYTRILLCRLKGSLDDRQYRNLENVQTSSHNLLNLINEILDLSRIEAGRIEVKPADVGMKSLATECAASISSLVGPGVTFHRELQDVAPIRSPALRCS
jgi:signal transduction histidine kinase